MRGTLFLFLAQTRLFWKTRAALSQLVFFGYRMLFGVKHRIREEGTATKSILSLLRLTLGELVFAIFIAMVLQYLNPYIVPWFTEQGLSIPIESNYVTLLATIIGVGGVFIGLYYAAISAIGGAIYARVPNNIRELLAQEQVGNTYMRCLAVLTYLGVCLLAFHTVGLEQVILAVPIFILGAGVIIIGFVRLGARAFYLFDPTSLSYHLFEQLRQCLVQMQAGGYRWSDPSFQNHAHKVAQTTIDTIVTESDIASKEPHLNARPFANLCKDLLLFLCHYETAKKSIPSDSLWFQRKYVHPEWYRSDDTVTSTAHETATGLKPESISDTRWIESAVLPIVKRCLILNMREHRYAIVYELLKCLDNYVMRLSKEHQVKFAFNLINDVYSWCENLIFVAHDKPVAKESLEYMETLERLARMPISVLVSYVHTTESSRRDMIRQRVSQVKWHSNKSIYQAGFALHLLKQLEWLRPRLEYENRIDESIISPSWYIQELIAITEAENFSATMICLHNDACKLYKQWIKNATSSQHPWSAAVVMSAELEYWSKLDYHRNTLKVTWNDLTCGRQLQELSWPSLDSDDLKRNTEQRQIELLKLMSDQNVLFSLIERPESYPDYAGRFLHTVGEALLSAMCENDSDTVMALFKSYYYGSFAQYEQLIPKENTIAWQKANDTKVAVSPILDLMDISGYVYLLSEYHDAPQLKKIVAKEWDTYLDQGSVNQRHQFLAAAVYLTELEFELPHRSVNRTRWNLTVVKRLKDGVKRREAPREWGLFGHLGTVVMHMSPLVRIFARDYIPAPYDGIDIFLYKYMSRREDGKDLDYGRRRRKDIEKAIEREESRYTEAIRQWDIESDET